MKNYWGSGLGRVNGQDLNDHIMGSGLGGVSGRNIVCKAFSKMDQLVGVGSIDEGALCGCALRSGMAK